MPVARSATPPASSTHQHPRTAASTANDNAVGYRAGGVRIVEFECDGGPVGNVWGSRLYADHSSVCGAAIHAGKLAAGQAGKVRVVITSGLSLYQGTLSNGIQSYEGPAAAGSFIVSGVTLPGADGSAPAGTAAAMHGPVTPAVDALAQLAEQVLSLIHLRRSRRSTACRSPWPQRQ